MTETHFAWLAFHHGNVGLAVVWTGEASLDGTKGDGIDGDVKSAPFLGQGFSNSQKNEVDSMREILENAYKIIGV